VIDLAWKIEWISIAAATDMRCPEGSDTRRIQREFPFSADTRMAA
jgi:hypothetical protein